LYKATFARRRVEVRAQLVRRLETVLLEPPVDIVGSDEVVDRASQRLDSLEHAAVNHLLLERACG
jgi:hypothetical protein